MKTTGYYDNKNLDGGKISEIKILIDGRIVSWFVDGKWIKEDGSIEVEEIIDTLFYIYED